VSSLKKKGKIGRVVISKAYPGDGSIPEIIKNSSIEKCVEHKKPEEKPLEAEDAMYDGFDSKLVGS
jgi:predicted GNAT family N-acyltransferase